MVHIKKKIFKKKKAYVKPLLTSPTLMFLLAQTSHVAKSKDNGARK